MIIPVVDRSLRTAPNLRKSYSTLSEARGEETALAKVIRVRRPDPVRILNRLRLA